MKHKQINSTKKWMNKYFNINVCFQHSNQNKTIDKKVKMITKLRLK